MNKREFIETLERELGNMDANARAEIINDFAEHFDIATASGKSEEEIARVLGDPKEIAKEFAAGRGGEEAVGTETGYGYADGGAYPGYASNDAHGLEPGEMPSEGTRPIDPAQMSVDGALIKWINAGRIKTIRMELITSDLQVRGEDTEYITLEIDQDDEAQFQSWLTGDGAFYIKQNKTRHRGGADVTLRMPEAFAGVLEIVGRSGDIAAEKLRSLSSLKIKANSGDIEVKRVICAKDLSMSIGSGDVSVEEVSADWFMVKTGSGDVETHRVVTKDAFGIATGSGELTLRACACAKGFNVSTGSGDVDSTGCVGNFRTSTGSGDVSVSNHEGTVWASTGSGDIDISTDAILSDVTYSTGSGDINIVCQRLEGNVRMSSGSSDINFRAREVNGDITAKTASGNIDVSLGRDSDVNFKLKVGKYGSCSNEFYGMKDRQGRPMDGESGRYTIQLETVTGDIDVHAV